MIKDRTDETLGARVFISCGQRTEAEKDIGLEAMAHFLTLGFEAYFAERVHSLEALTENIIRHLSKSEYAVFIDCQRDKLPSGQCRGSLFVNQELAIAGFLRSESRILECLVFHQEGVQREGVAEYLITNPIRFIDKKDFLVKLEATTKNWRPDWRSELLLELGTVHRNLAIRNMPGKPLSDWYHLRVRNRHANRDARNCVAYITTIKKLGNGKTIEVFVPGDLRLTWAGTGLYERHIQPKTADAEIDAFYVININGRDQIQFQCRPTTSDQYAIPSLGKGHYEFTYLVVSENFERVQKSFRLKFGGDRTKVEFSEKTETSHEN